MEKNPCDDYEEIVREEHIPHDPEPTEEQLAIQSIVDRLFRRLKY